MTAGQPNARGWFERAIVDLSIAQAHLVSGLWLEAGRHARQAALKFLQAGLAAKGKTEPSPRISVLCDALRIEHPAFEAKAEWLAFDKLAGVEALSEGEGRTAVQWAGEIRDAVAKLLG